MMSKLNSEQPLSLDLETNTINIAKKKMFNFLKKTQKKQLVQVVCNPKSKPCGHDSFCCANTMIMPAIVMHTMPARLIRSGVIFQNIHPKMPTEKRYAYSKIAA